MSTPLTVTIAGASQATGLSSDFIRDAVNKAELPAKRAGRRIIIRWADLQQWVNGMENVA